jgi:hypothetical protein
MLMSGFMLMILMRVQRLILMATAKAFQAMAVVKERDLLRAGAIANITTCQAKDLGPAKS